MKGEPLFATPDLRAVCQNHEQATYRAIDSMDGDRFLSASLEELCDEFVSQFALDPPTLQFDEITVDQDEDKLDVSQDRMRDIRDRTRAFYIPATTFSMYVPFDGDPDLFRYQPSRYTTMPPYGTVASSELILSVTTTSPDATAVRASLNRELARVQQYLGWVHQDAAEFNGALRTSAERRIAARRERLLRDRGTVAELGFPLRQRPGAPRTYTVPTRRRQPVVQRLPRGTRPFVPEPALDPDEYEGILAIISSMVRVIEQSPRSFRRMKEEDLRQHFLVQLNGQYEGQATGETFNFEGKTDILIKVDGRNVFIAECKFWRGPKSLTEAVDQLLGYASWRDTKTAIILFNRTKNFSGVLAKIPEIMKQHPQYKRDLPATSETSFRYVFRHRDDPDRELTAAVLAFEVPV
jgi:hypothetical protein